MQNSLFFNLLANLSIQYFVSSDKYLGTYNELFGLIVISGFVNTRKNKYYVRSDSNSHDMFICALDSTFSGYTLHL